MLSIYAHQQKITNAVGRSIYLNDKEKQEEIVLIKKKMLHTWKEHADFEKGHQKSDCRFYPAFLNLDIIHSAKQLLILLLHYLFILFFPGMPTLFV